MHLVKTGKYSKDYATFKGGVRDFYNPLHSRRIKRSKPWGPADDEYLEMRVLT